MKNALTILQNAKRLNKDFNAVGHELIRNGFSFVVRESDSGGIINLPDGTKVYEQAEQKTFDWLRSAS